MDNKARVLIDQCGVDNRIICDIGKVHIAALVNASSADASLPKQGDPHTQVTGDFANRLFHTVAELNTVQSFHIEPLTDFVE
jgi:hypothetical protein